MIKVFPFKYYAFKKEEAEKIISDLKPLMEIDNPFLVKYHDAFISEE